MTSRYNESVTTKLPGEFQWLYSDGVIAHALGIQIDPEEMDELAYDIARCFCQFPNLGRDNRCSICKRRFVFSPHHLPPAQDPTA